MSDLTAMPLAISGAGNLIRCPECGAAAFQARGRAYCPKCPWGRQKARWAIRRSLVFPSVYLVIWLYFLPKAEKGLHIVLFSVAILGLLFFFRRVHGEWKVMRAVEKGEYQHLELVVPERELPVYTAQAPSALSGPIPRNVELRTQPKVFLSLGILVAGAVAVFVMLNREQIGSTQAWGIVSLGMLISLLCGGKFWWHRHLARVGSVGMARVLRQRSWGKDDHRVYYEFGHPNGKTVRADFQDESRSLYEGMHFPVFYSERSARNPVPVAACWFQVIMQKPVS